jgi:ABC-2 type transport system permease protein
MTTLQAAAPLGAALTADAPRVTFGRLIRSEWIKLRSVRSTFWVTALTVVLGLGSAWMMVASMIDYAPDDSFLTREGGVVMLANQGVVFPAEILLLVMGVLAATTEYTSGSIRSTLLAAPTRGKMLAAKAVVVGSAAAVLSAATVGLATWLALAVASSRGLDLEVGSAGLKAAAGAVIFLVATALVGLGLGFVIRSSAGAISAGVGLFVVVDVVLRLVAFSAVAAHLLEFTPNQAAVLLYADAVPASSAGFEPLVTTFGAALAVVGCWVVAALAAGYVVLRKRDA